MESITEKLFWALDGHDALEQLKTRASGLSEEEALKRQKNFGKNEIRGDGRIKKLAIFLSQFESPLIFILLTAGIATVFFQDWLDAAVIFLAVVVNTALGFYQENRAAESLAHLKTYLKERTRVVRAGREYEIDVIELVPGDIIHLTMGARVPADARIITNLDLYTDESILTGESLPVAKTIEKLVPSVGLSDRTNMVYGGTLVVEGSGNAVVTAIGRDSEIGRIAELVSKTEDEITPLQRSVSRLAWLIAGALLIIIGAIFLLGIRSGLPVFDMFLVSVAMAVGAIPEGLPIALTVILAVGVEQLAHRKGVVRKLLAAEALGSTTLILTDKTGTLTEAKMRLSDIVTKDMLIRIDGGNYKDGSMLADLNNEQREILKVAIINADVLIENPKVRYAKWRIIGRPLERNIVMAAACHKILLTQFQKKVKYLNVLSFNSVNKFSVSSVSASDVFELPLTKNKNFLAILGAPDILLDRSRIKKEDYLRAHAGIDALAVAGRRVLGVAVMPLDGKEEVRNLAPAAVKDVIFLGVLSFYDPVRPEVVEAMQHVERFGVRTIIVTGDHKGTALSVARELGWQVDESNILEGKDLSGIKDEELHKYLDKIRIFARVSPQDKVRIAQAYKKMGETVAMTGDGVNDAPSMQAVDIGVAVGSGTDVAKDVADLVLLDDNFHTLVAAIEEGRRIISNIRKVTVYLLSDSLDEVILIGASLVAGFPLPLTALQILWVNLFSDSFPALAFAFERNSDDVGRVSRAKRQPIWGSEVKFLILVVGVATSALLFVVYWWMLRHTSFDEQVIRTFIFASFGVYTLFVAFPLRNLRKSIFTFNPLSNKYLNVGVVLGILLMALAIYVPPLQKILGTTALSAPWLLGIAVIILINIFAIEITKFIFSKTAKRI